MPTINEYDRMIDYEETDEIKQKVFDEVIRYFEKHGAYSGEVICQSDNCIIDAPSVLARIADKIIKFKVNDVE